MYIYSKVSRLKVYHSADCSHAKQIKSCNKTYFYTKEEAEQSGYTACNCCCRMARNYQKERSNILDFCKIKQLDTFLFNNALYIVSKLCTWKIVEAGHSKQAMLLYHENTRDICYKRDQMPYHLRSYHWQNTHQLSIIGYLNYIALHDEWRCKKREQELETIKNQPLYTKRKKKAMARAKRADRRYQIRRVLDLIDQLPSI